MLIRFTDTPGVPRFYGHLTDQENWYLVIEYIAIIWLLTPVLAVCAWRLFAH